MIKQLYLQSPPTIQNAAISLYGLKKYQERYLGRVPEDYQELGDLFSLPTKEQFKTQAKQLSALLSHARDHVPYYQKHLKGVDVASITPENLPEHLPVITKNDLLENPSSFISTNALHSLLSQRLFTSGSSGTPLEFRATNISRRINYRYYEKALNTFGCSYRTRSTTLAGRVLYKPGSKEVARYDHFNKTQYLSSYAISLDTIEQYIAALNSWKPGFIDSYPSALVEIISLARQKSLAVSFSPKVIITSSENLTMSSRALIETFFNCTVLDQYGCTEMAVNAFSIGGHYYSDPRYSVNEIDASLGESGSLICTSLFNRVMPLVRYKIGDIVTPVNGNPYLFESIDGRLDDTIVTPEGKRIGRIDPAFKGIQGIELAQVIQTNLDQITIKVVLSNRTQFNPELLIHNMTERTSAKFKIDIQCVDSIQKESNGKFKSVINKCT